MSRRLTFSTGAVNDHGYRLLPEGMIYDKFLKNPVILAIHNNKKWPIGRAEDLKLQNGEWSCLPVWDEEDDVGKEVKSKWERGFLHAASVWNKPLEASTDKKYIKPGQTRPTVIKWILREISMVPVPADPDAAAGDKLALSDGQTINDILPKLIINKKNMEPEIKYQIPISVMTKLGLQNASEQDVLSAIDNLQSRVKLSIEARNKALIEKGKAKGVITDENQKHYLALAESNYENTLSIINAAPEKKKAEAGDEPEPTMKEILTRLASGKKSEKEDTKSFDYLQMNDPDELVRIQKEEPEKYEKLALAYANRKPVKKPVK